MSFNVNQNIQICLRINLILQKATLTIKTEKKPHLVLQMLVKEFLRIQEALLSHPDKQHNLEKIGKLIIKAVNEDNDLMDSELGIDIERLAKFLSTS